MDILSQIIAKKRLTVESAKLARPIEPLRKAARDLRAEMKANAFRDALADGTSINIIAEFKRCSPSKGTIRENADAATIARSYESAGAVAISVLTEENYFAGSLDDLLTVRAQVSIPILRKDFVFDEWQVYESAASGADALLLIVAALDDETLARLLRLTEDDLGLDALVEVHTRDEMERAVAHDAKLIGVNNRDLRTFDVSTESSLLLARFAPAGAVLVSESGLTPDELPKLKAAGYRGFLIGETLMRASDPARQLRTFKGEN